MPPGRECGELPKRVHLHESSTHPRLLRQPLHISTQHEYRTLRLVEPLGLHQLAPSLAGFMVKLGCSQAMAFDGGAFDGRVYHAFGESCGVGHHQGVNDPQMVLGAVDLTQICFPYLLFMSLTALQSGVLNSLNRFTAAAAAVNFSTKPL